MLAGGGILAKACRLQRRATALHHDARRSTSISAPRRWQASREPRARGGSDEGGDWVGLSARLGTACLNLCSAALVRYHIIGTKQVKNEAAAAFYRRLGFEEVRIDPQYYKSIQPTAAFVFKKTILPVSTLQTIVPSSWTPRSLIFSLELNFTFIISLQIPTAVYSR